MADHAHSIPVSDVHPLDGSSPPGAGAPSFEPVVTRKYVMAFPPNHMLRTPEQRLLDMNHRYDRALKFYDVAWGACEEEHDPAKKDDLDNAVGHALRIVREIQEEAYNTPAGNLRAIALKARIMSGAKKTWWDPSEQDVDRDARLLIEDILALAGMDRIYGYDFEFSDLLAGYDGPKMFEAAPDQGTSFSTHPAVPKIDPAFWTATVQHAHYDRATHPEGALISFSGMVAALQEEEHKAWDQLSELSDKASAIRRRDGRRKESGVQYDDIDEKLGVQAAEAVATSLSNALVNAMRELALQPARTPEGLAAKAGILDAIGDWLQDGFGELALSVAKDALWIGTQSRFQISHLDNMLKERSPAEVAA